MWKSAAGIRGDRARGTHTSCRDWAGETAVSNCQRTCECALQSDSAFVRGRARILRASLDEQSSHAGMTTLQKEPSAVHARDPDLGSVSREAVTALRTGSVFGLPRVPAVLRSRQGSIPRAGMLRVLTAYQIPTPATADEPACPRGCLRASPGLGLACRPRRTKRSHLTQFDVPSHACGDFFPQQGATLHKQGRLPARVVSPSTCPPSRSVADVVTGWLAMSERVS